MLIQTDADIARGLAALAELDPRLKPVIEASGDVPLRRRPGGLEGLAAIIVSQQLSVASASAIWKRFAQTVTPLEAATLAAARDDTLKAAGLSAPKIRTLRAVAEAILDERLVLDALDACDPEAAVAALTAVKGIGPWTAEIYLLFCLGHPDVMPAGDLALQEAARIALSLDARPTAKVLAAEAEAWAPWRGVAARLLWAYYAAVKRREGVTGD